MKYVIGLLKESLEQGEECIRLTRERYVLEKIEEEVYTNTIKHLRPLNEEIKNAIIILQNHDNI
jgi:hypothetical protein